VKCKEFIKEASQQGWVLLRQAKGSHAIYIKNGKKVSIPSHGSKEIPKGLEKKLRKEMGME
jgi:mRNA interferase HicA